MRFDSRRRIIALTFVLAFSMSLTSLPASIVHAAEVCQGPAAYPPDLPDCLDPVVVAKQEADAKAAADASAAASASAKAAAELLEQQRIAALIVQNDLAAAAAAAKVAADKAAAEKQAAEEAQARAEAEAQAQAEAAAAKAKAEQEAAEAAASA